MKSSLPSLEQDFERIQTAFAAIARYTGSRRRHALCVYAPFFGIPRAEFRKIFELWLIEQNSNQKSASASNTDALAQVVHGATHEN